MNRVRFRPHQSILIAAFIGFVGILPIAFGPSLPSDTNVTEPSSDVRWIFVPLLLIPIAVFVWVLRSGTDADASGLRVRGLLGTKRIPWSEVRELATDDRGRAVVLLRDGYAVTLSSVRRDDVNRLIEASGQGIVRQKNT
ncbi:PH domain-containing protein [Asanoa sp. WMMD1127]|uniref:PH domain-containing protein n=1 Tax=Asanoa sp. WMMD1127 TaxID=3016107 RepID=UPI002416B45C|nr:PH domain-containing protein [Asanoa sp. WMMD1127]MDG4823472.1 PH domain-containing protein [Asanoa sp. WMMD1127]